MKNSDLLKYLSKQIQMQLPCHWKGELFTSIDKALGLARTMTYHKVVPSTVRLVKIIYKRGVSLTKSRMKKIERRLNRLEGLEKWFIEISPSTSLG